jgi:hypothetical protein
METFNNFAELLESTQNAPFDVTSNPNGTVTPGAVQPPAPVPATGSEGNPPGWHNSLAQKVTGIDQRLTNVGGRLTNLEGKVDQGFAKVDQGFDIVEHMRTDMAGMKNTIGKMENAITEINKKLS